MFDINLIREDYEKVSENLKRRKNPELLKLLKQARKLDDDWRKLKHKTDELRHERNSISEEINKLKKEKKDFKKLIDNAKKIPAELKRIDDEQKAIQAKLRMILMSIPNILDESVPYGKDSSDNVEIKVVGRPAKPQFQLLPHPELIEHLKLADFERSAKISGSGFYFLKGQLALLNQALIRYAIDFMVSKGYTYIETPLMMNREAYEGVTDLDDFEKVMYKIEGEDNYLIATSEHPLVGQHMQEVLEAGSLPLKYAGYSMCFRREVGSHGIDTKGLFRTHQFNKVEQIIICKPEDSPKLHEEIQKNSEDIYKNLGIPYRVVNICTGDIGILANKKYDIEAWYPRGQEYREVGSASNCTDYQARRLDIRYRTSQGTAFVHTLNNTAIATSRCMAAILENYQNKDKSITVPKVLVPYMNGLKKITAP